MKFRILLAACLFVISYQAVAATGDTTVILAHTNTNLTDPPSNYDEWVVFPNTGATYQQIIMKFTLGCGSPQCSGWDYTVNTEIGKKTGLLDSTIVMIDTLTNDTVWNVFERLEYIELGRLITPYGTYMANNSNGFNGSWTHPYYYDVTDYAELLKDSVSVRVHYDGWTRAFSAKVEFVLIEGPPNRVVESVREVYHTYIGYPNSAGFENVAVPKTFPIAANVTSAKVMVLMTGHGSQGEFDPHNFTLKVNGTVVAQKLLWKDDCDITAIAPQGGTWVFARANWCPGEKVPVFEIDVTPYITSGQNVTLDLDFDDYTVQQNQSAGYGTSVHLITYTTQQNNDVMMEEIIAPNNDKTYLHWNPISTKPKVKIKNMGKLPLTYAEISYWVEGGEKWYFEWSGNLSPFESELIELPSFGWNGLDTTRPVFFAEAKWPNQKPDEFTPNNILSASFNMAPRFDSVFVVQFRTNNHPEENWWLIRDEDGDTLILRSNLAASTTFRDTISLPGGSYFFDMFDYDANWGCGDGISWWLNTQQNLETSGQLSLRRMNNTAIKTFNGDFGGNIHYEFTVGYPLGYNPPKTPPLPPVHPTDITSVTEQKVDMQVFPNPTRDILNVVIDLNRASSGVLEIADVAGRIVERRPLVANTHHAAVIPVNELSAGMYYVSFVSAEGRVTRKVIAAK